MCFVRNIIRLSPSEALRIRIGGLFAHRPTQTHWTKHKRCLDRGRPRTHQGRSLPRGGQPSISDEIRSLIQRSGALD